MNGSRLDAVRLIAFDAGVKNRLYANGGDAGRADDHVFARIDLRNWDVDKFFGGCLGHELIAIPFLKILDGREADFFFVPTVESDVDDVFAGSSRHFTSLGFQMTEVSIGRWVPKLSSQPKNLMVIEG